MNTFKDIQDYVLDEINDTSSTMRNKAKRYINTILQNEFLGCKYSWNLNATTVNLSSGASTMALPSLMADYNVDNFFNLTYSNPMRPGGKRRIMQMGSNGIAEYYWRQGNNFVFPPISSDQSVYFEWFPQHASLVSDGAIPLVPNKQVIAEGALWLAMKRLSKKDAGEQGQIFFSMKSQLQEDDSNELVEIEDSDMLYQRG